MKKLFFVFVCILVCYICIFADDGGSYYPDKWTYGNIYVKEPNQKIALENEILEFNSNFVKAIFDFKNTTNENVKVPCSFPVILKVPFKINNGLALPKSNYNVVADSMIWEIALNRHIPETSQSHWYDTIALTDILSKDKTLRVETYSDYISQLSSYYSKERYEDHDVQAYSGCKILLDGYDILIKNVGIEVNVEYNPKSEFIEDEERYNSEYSYLTVILHFFHELEFKPSKHSKLEVSYIAISKRQSYHGLNYEGFYDISTGGTWKGNMKNFFVFSPMNMIINSGEKEPLSFKEDGIGNFYYFTDYKPSSKEYFVFTLREYGEEFERPIFESDFKKQDFVKDVQASSFLKGYFQYYKLTRDNYYFYDEQAIKTSGYQPETCFDCDPYNGWCEGVKGDGIGQWISFTLTKKVFGPFAINGLTKHSSTQKEYSYNGLPEEKYYDIWMKNNRIKRMKLNSSQDFKKNLDFEDIYSGFMSGDVNFNKQLYNAIINPTILEPDTYKMIIDDVYKGTKYDDTVLGEIWFYEFSQQIEKIIDIDKQLEMPIFTEYIENLFVKSLVDTTYAKYFSERLSKFEE